MSSPTAADDRLEALALRLAAAEAQLATAAAETAVVRGELAALRGELAAGASTAAPSTPRVSGAEPAVAPAPQAPPRGRPGAVAGALATALSELQAGNHGAVLFELERALREVRASGEDDPDARAEIRRLATTTGIASPRHRTWAADVAARAGRERAPGVAGPRQPPERVEQPDGEPGEAWPSQLDRLVAWARERVGAGVDDSGATLGDRLLDSARAWLTGARLLALGGGLVSLLGVVLVFALAVDRGWLGETGRVLIGAAVSAAFVVVAFVLRRRGREETAVTAAAATGVAGGFVTLYVATAPYDLVPDAVAPFALAAIAAVAIVLALFWSSQFLAVFGLLGAMVGPVLVRAEVDAGALAFALTAFAVALALAWARRWVPLVVAAGTTAAVLATVFALDAEGGGLFVALLCLSAALAYATAVVCALRLWQEHGARLALLTILPLLAASYLRDGPAPWVLGIAAAVAAVAALAARRLGWSVLAATTTAIVGVLGVLATAAIVGERSTTIAWAVEAVALVALLVRYRSVSLLLAGLAYLTVAGVVLFAQELEHVVEDSGGSRSVVRLSVFAAAAAAVAVLLAVAGRLPLPETGLMRWAGTGLDRGRVAVQVAVRGAAALALASALSVGLDGTALALAAGGAAATVLVLGAWRQEGDLDAIGAFLAAVSFAAFLAEPGIAPPIAWSGIAAGLALLTVVRPLSVRTSVAAHGGLGLALLGLLRLDGEELVLVETGAAGHAAAWLVLALAAATAFEVGTRLARRPANAVAREGEESTPFLAGLAVAAGLCLLVSGLLLVALLALVVVALAAASRLGSRSHLALAAAAGLAYPLWATVIGLDGEGRVAAGLALTALAGAVLAELAGPDRELDRLSLGGVADAVSAAPWRALVLGAQAFACFVATTALVVAVDDDAVRAMAISVAAVAVAAAIQVAAGWRTTLQAWLAGLVPLALGLSLEVARPLLLFRRVGPDAGHVVVAAVLAGCVLGVAGLVRLFAAALADDARGPYRRVAAILAGVATLFAASLAVRAAVPHLGGGADAQFQRSQTAVSILWALAAIALLFAGLARRERLLRLGGFVLLGVAVAKIFLFDLDRLSSLARALSFLGVGALLLVGGWLVQRYAERLEGGDGS